MPVSARAAWAVVGEAKAQLGEPGGEGCQFLHALYGRLWGEARAQLDERGVSQVCWCCAWAAFGMTLAPTWSAIS